jgi:subtilase family serine protease
VRPTSLCHQPQGLSPPISVCDNSLKFKVFCEFCDVVCFFEATIHFIFASVRMFIIYFTLLKECTDYGYIHNASVWSFECKVENPTSALTPVGALFTLPNFIQNTTFYGVGPYDFATIYNVSPLWNATPAINGTGQTIAIVGETDVDFVDLQKFRALFGITSNDPTMIVDGPDPGLQPDEIESDLDLEWSSAVAPGAAIKFVVAATTDTTLGVDLAAQYIVDHNVAPIVSESYAFAKQPSAPPEISSSINSGSRQPRRECLFSSPAATAARPDAIATIPRNSAYR